jgi:hypothetical protein
VKVAANLADGPAMARFAKRIESDAPRANRDLSIIVDLHILLAAQAQLNLVPFRGKQRSLALFNFTARQQPSHLI